MANLVIPINLGGPYVNPDQNRRTNPAKTNSRAAFYAEWDPRFIPGLVGWWDASRITGLADGDPVATWPDSSGNGNDLTQATASRRPVYRAGVLNGLPVIRYDGVDDWLITVLGTPISGTRVSAFAVFSFMGRFYGRVVSLQNTNEVADYGGAYSGIAIYVATGSRIAAYRQSPLSSFSASTSTWYIATSWWDGSRHTMMQGLISSSPVNTSQPFLVHEVRLGHAKGGGSDELLQGDIHAVALYDRDLSADERERLVRYYSARTAIPV